MTRVARISSGASSAARISATPRKPTASPITAPPTPISTKRTAASPKDGAPARMVARTALNTATPVPSLSRLSPSRMAASPEGALSCRSNVTTAIGSVAARIEPSSMPLAQLKPSNRWVRVPIKSTVAATPAVARRPTGRRRRLNSGKSSVSAASNTSPGRTADGRVSRPGRARSPARPPGSATAGSAAAAKLPLDLQDHAVPRCLDLCAQSLREVGGQLPWVGAPHCHPEMREDGEPRLGVPDDAFDVGKAQVREARATLHQHEVDDHHLGLVLLGDAFVVLGIRHPAELVGEAEPERLRLVHMAWTGRERKAVDVVGRLGLQAHDLLRKLPEVLKHHRIVVERIGGTEQPAAVPKSAVRHRLDHDIDVAGVVEVAVAQDDCVELGQIDLALGVLHDGAGPGIETEARAAFLQVQAAGRRELLRDHEPRAGCAHERDFHLYLPTLWGGWPGPRRGPGRVGMPTSTTSVRDVSVFAPK